jgi:polyisoprenoid-binding protein YceI
MKRFAVIIAAILIGLFPVIGQEKGWTLDKSHSKVEFSVVHMALSEVTGRFKEFDLTFTFAKEDFSDAVVNATISTVSITTDHERRDNHLKGDDFFNVVQYPTITFAGKSFEKGDGNRYKITGDLTIRDSTKTVTFDAEYKGTITTQQGPVMGWKAMTVINRFDFNLKWNRMIENVGLVAGQDVTITLNLEFRKQK